MDVLRLFTTSEGLVRVVRFTAHSVVERADGSLIDITPNSRASQRYPFILTKAESKTS
jgi:hypothetical protein